VLAQLDLWWVLISSLPAGGCLFICMAGSTRHARSFTHSNPHQAIRQWWRLTMSGGFQRLFHFLWV
jgi:hypothetical protein